MSGAGLVAVLCLRWPGQSVAEFLQYLRRLVSDTLNTSANYISLQILFLTDIYLSRPHLTCLRREPRPHEPWPMLHCDQGVARHVKLSHV